MAFVGVTAVWPDIFGGVVLVDVLCLVVVELSDAVFDSPNKLYCCIDGYELASTLPMVLLLFGIAFDDDDVDICWLLFGQDSKSQLVSTPISEFMRPNTNPVFGFVGDTVCVQLVSENVNCVVPISRSDAVDVCTAGMILSNANGL